MIGHLLLPLICSFFFLSGCLTLWLLVNTLCTCTSGLSCQFAWVNKYWNYTTMVLLFRCCFTCMLSQRKQCMKSKINGNIAKNPKINSPWGAAKISSMIKYKNSHPQTPLKITTCSTHLFYSKSALIFYWLLKTILIPQPVYWINSEISIWISRNTHVVWLSKRLIASCTLDESDINIASLPCSHI